MIKKERLKELIEQCATVYMARAYTEGIYLMPENFEVNDKELVFKYKLYVVPLEDLFETEEEAKWFAEFCCIERTERLELPTWEEFIEKEEVIFYSKHNYKTFITIIGTKYLVVERLFERYFTGELTKENYYEACRKAKELFLGENK